MANEKQTAVERHLEAADWREPIKFTGDPEEDYRLAREWKTLYARARLCTPEEGRERLDEEALRYFEGGQWEHRLTTQEGSRYFITASGVVMRVKRHGPSWDQGVQPPTRLLGFVPGELESDWEESANAVKRGNICNNRLVHTTVAGEQDDQYAPTTITFRNLSPQPQVGFHPLDTIPRGRIEQMELDPKKGEVSFTYDSRLHPNIHMGTAITEIEG